MNLFYDDGHLSDDGLSALLAGSLDELESLEAAEHLSFCDECLLRYTGALTEETLLVPEAPLKPSVMKRIKRRAGLVLFNKYTTVAAAACLAMALWGSGMLPGLAQRITTGTAAPPAAAQTAQDVDTGVGTALNDAAGGFAGTLNKFFDGLTTPAWREARQQNTANRQAEREKEKRQQQENVFKKPAPDTPADQDTNG